MEEADQVEVDYVKALSLSQMEFENEQDLIIGNCSCYKIHVLLHILDLSLCKFLMNREKDKGNPQCPN